MSRKILRAIAALTLFALLITPLAVLAHKTIVVGDYTLEYGWLNEPPVAGQDNAIILNIGGAEEEHGHDEPTGAISLIAPADGITVAGDTVEVSVKIEGVGEEAGSFHWHLYVDDEVLIMAPLSQPTVTVKGLSNGVHLIKVMLADTDHTEYGEPAAGAITVEGSTASGKPSVSGLEEAEEHGEETTDEHGHGEEGLTVDLSGLKLALVYGGQTTALVLEPLKDGQSGQFVAPFKPERAGLYTLKISGKLSGDFGDTEVNVEVEPEEVTPGDSAPVDSAPTAAPEASSGLWIWIAVGIGVVAVIGVGVAVFVTRKK